ncbi:MAG: hypothetical protein F6K61_11825 [Sphaerospermopsis sp. SIO1G1]|nr:hypothetical protein [Sphaerospermopsis sp. SIO1G1]
MSSSQQSSFANKIKFALIGTLVLGGGSLALILSQNLMNKNQTQNNPQVTIKNDNNDRNNNTSQGGSVGDISVGNINVNPLTKKSSSNNQQPGSSSTTSSQSNGGQNPSNNTPTGEPTSISNPSSARPAIDVKSDNIKWSLTYPIYKIQNEKCLLAGAAAVTLHQSRGGELSHRGILNVYGWSRIQGTVTASGKVNISISSDNGDYIVTLDGEDAQISTDEIVIAGKATMLECQESTFELKK